MQPSPVTLSHHSNFASEETKKSPAHSGARIIRNIQHN